MSSVEKVKGVFVSVGSDIGVIVGLAGETDIPEDHLGIWYGETTEDNTPLYRTVPEEYCSVVTTVESYH